MTGDDEPTPDHLAFKLSFDKATDRQRHTAQLCQNSPRKSCGSSTMNGPSSPPIVSGQMAVGDKNKGLSDKAAQMFHVIRAALNRYGAPQKTEENGKEHIAADRQTIRQMLIHDGWFAEENMLSDPLEKNSNRKANKGDPLSAAFQRGWVITESQLGQV